jgi:hypothetical protein
MAGTAVDAGKSFLAGVLAKLPEALRGQVETAFNDTQATDALVVLGTGALAQPEINRRLDEIREQEEAIKADYERLNGWYLQQETKLKTFDQIAAENARLKGNGNLNLTAKKDDPPPSSGFTKEDFDKAINERERAAATYFNATNRMAIEHLQRFGEVLDLDDLARFSESKRVNIFDGYKEKFADRLASKAKEAEDARVNKIVEERLAEERRKQQDQPFPLRGQAPSVLDVLAEKDGPAKHTLDTATALYEQLQSTGH